MATPLPVITKVTADGGSVYLSGSQVTYTISANCNTGSTGNLFMENGSLTDPLPAGVTFVSATPTPTSSTSTSVTWNFPTAAARRPAVRGSTGATSYRWWPAPTRPPRSSQPLEHRHLRGHRPDANDPAGVTGTTTAEADVDVVDSPPRHRATVRATRPSPSPRWPPWPSGRCPATSTPAPTRATGCIGSTTPTYSVGAAAGSYQVMWASR